MWERMEAPCISLSDTPAARPEKSSSDRAVEGQPEKNVDEQ